MSLPSLVYALLTLALAAGISAAEPPASNPADCPLVPRPKVWKPTSRTLPLAATGVAIVVGEKATPPELYAAERLQSLIERRFARKLAISTEKQIPRDTRQVILLGQRSTHALLDAFCKDQAIELDADKPGPDGFVIEVAEAGGQQTVLIGGSNPRAVTYGQEVFFDLLRRDGDSIVFPVVSLRDWPSIPWRGRPLEIPSQHLAEGVFDTYVRTRTNWIDLRFGQYGAVPGATTGWTAINPEVSRKVIAAAHQRGIFVYGTVYCAGITPEKYALVLATFQQLLDLGVDGLWMSFDDGGAEPGSDALIRQVLELGRKHDMTGRRIAITPAGGKSYLVIDAPFNRQTAAIPGMENACWMFTIPPRAANLVEARKIGLQTLPAWWHNWPRPSGSFVSEPYKGRSYLPKKDPVYHPLPPLSQTTVTPWGNADYDVIREGYKFTDTVMLWNTWLPEEYLTGPLCLWAWDPATHDWERTRRALYATIFGAAQTEKAAAFDDQLTQLEGLFNMPTKRAEPWGCALKDPQDRAKALHMVDALDALVKELEIQAPAQTLLPPARLQTYYLKPMHATCTWARKIIPLDYPEYSFPEDQIRQLRAAGKNEEARQLLETSRPKVLAQLETIRQQLDGLDLNSYLKKWQDRVASLDNWK